MAAVSCCWALRQRRQKLACLFRRRVAGHVGLAHRPTRRSPSITEDGAGRARSSYERLIDRVVRADRDHLALRKFQHLCRRGVRLLGHATDDNFAIGHHAREPVVITTDGEAPTSRSRISGAASASVSSIRAHSALARACACPNGRTGVLAVVDDQRRLSDLCYRALKGARRVVLWLILAAWASTVRSKTCLGHPRAAFSWE